MPGWSAGAAPPDHAGEAPAAQTVGLPGGRATWAGLAAILSECGDEIGMHGQFLPLGAISARWRRSCCRASQDAPECQDAVTTRQDRCWTCQDVPAKEKPSLYVLSGMNEMPNERLRALLCAGIPECLSPSNCVELGATGLREESDWVALGPVAAEHVGSHLWLPRRLEGREPLGAKIDWLLVARCRSGLCSREEGSWRTEFTRCRSRRGSGYPPGDHARDAETPEWAGRYMSLCIRSCRCERVTIRVPIRR